VSTSPSGSLIPLVMGVALIVHGVCFLESGRYRNWLINTKKRTRRGHVVSDSEFHRFRYLSGGVPIASGAVLCIVAFLGLLGR